MTIARDHTGAVVGQLLPDPHAAPGSVPGWLRLLTRGGKVIRVPNGSVRLEELR